MFEEFPTDMFEAPPWILYGCTADHNTIRDADMPICLRPPIGISDLTELGAVPRAHFQVHSELFMYIT